MSDTFKCSGCGETKAVNMSSGTGYAICADRRHICYACCGKMDRAEMEKADRFTLYLSKKDGRLVVSNWPGTLEFKVQVSKTGRHNIAKTRTDCWFQDHTGKAWWGVSYGENTQIIHCRKLK